MRHQYMYQQPTTIETRGPHSYWFKQAASGAIIDTHSNGLVNMLHYEDAAAATIALATSTGITYAFIMHTIIFAKSFYLHAMNKLMLCI